MEKIWRKWILFSVWFAQIVLLLVLIGLMSAAVHYFSGFYEWEEPEASYWATRAAVLLALSCFTIILCFGEIFLFVRGTLRPPAHLWSQCVKTLIWAILTITSIVSAAHSNSGTGVAVAVILFLACLMQLVYGGFIYHRHRLGTSYRGTYSGVSIGPDGYSDANNERPPRGSYARPAYDAKFGITAGIPGLTPAPASAPALGRPTSQDPFRDPSPVPSAQSLQLPCQEHPGSRPSGESDEYYAASAAGQSLETRTTDTQHGA